MNHLCVKVSNTDLLIKHCKCGKIHIFGFYHQIPAEEQTVDIEQMKVTITQPCECGNSLKIKLNLYYDPSTFIAGAGI